MRTLHTQAAAPNCLHPQDPYIRFAPTKMRLHCSCRGGGRARAFRWRRKVKDEVLEPLALACPWCVYCPPPPPPCPPPALLSSLCLSLFLNFFYFFLFFIHSSPQLSIGDGRKVDLRCHRLGNLKRNGTTGERAARLVSARREGGREAGVGEAERRRSCVNQTGWSNASPAPSIV